MKCFLCFAGDPLDGATRCLSLTDALIEFHTVAKELNRFGQSIEASIHIAPTRKDIAEYPDYVLSLGPKGGIKKERC
jgi:hypothetical protein